MIHPIPSGTRDVLPDEMRELRAITEALRDVFGAAGYGEVYTPALEYETVITRGELASLRPAYRVFDENGNVLVLRSDMTVPIARVVATRYPASEPPLRFCYFAHSYRGVRPQRGQPREFLQAGVELIGASAPRGTAEAVTVLCRALDAVGLARYRLGHSSSTIRMHINVMPGGAQAPANSGADRAAAARDQSSRRRAAHRSRRWLASSTTVARPLIKRMSAERSSKS